MKKIMTSNDLFKIFFVENYDPDKNAITSYYELVETPNRTVEVFETFSLAEQVMQQKTEFWKALIKKIPLYFEVRFIA
ncbi:MAG: hypothetical protein B0W54_12820 [Cellvibrio sp. 79]|nr:MAG: hypothetical protein B0W54_12820 [Cellvibrio sp. 79]